MSSVDGGGASSYHMEHGTSSHTHTHIHDSMSTSTSTSKRLLRHSPRPPCLQHQSVRSSTLLLPPFFPGRCRILLPLPIHHYFSPRSSTFFRSRSLSLLFSSFTPTPTYYHLSTGTTCTFATILLLTSGARRCLSLLLPLLPCLHPTTPLPLPLPSHYTVYPSQSHPSLNINLVLTSHHTTPTNH